MLINFKTIAHYRGRFGRLIETKTTEKMRKSWEVLHAMEMGYNKPYETIADKEARRKERIAAKRKDGEPAKTDSEDAYIETGKPNTGSITLYYGTPAKELSARLRSLELAFKKERMLPIPANQFYWLSYKIVDRSKLNSLTTGADPDTYTRTQRLWVDYCSGVGYSFGFEGDDDVVMSVPTKDLAKLVKHIKQHFNSIWKDGKIATF